MHASNQCTLSCLATASFAIADGQQPGVGAIFCASEGTGLKGGGPQLLEGIGKQGRREGAFPSQSRVYRNAVFEDDCKAPSPKN